MIHMIYYKMRRFMPQARSGTNTNVLPPFLVMLLFAALLSGGAFLFVSAASHAQDELLIEAGDTVSGDVTNRFGQSWSFAGCAGDLITATATTTRFVPFLALSGSFTTTALTQARGVRTKAAIAAFPLPRNDNYSLLVAGSNIRDRGPYSLTLTSLPTSDRIDDESQKISPGQIVNGAVTNRFGVEFLFHGCANNLVTITMQSAAFVPHLELFGPIGRDPLITNDGATRAANGRVTARLRAFRLPFSGLYSLIAAGALTSDRGPFRLSMELSDGGALPPTLAPTPTATRTPTPTPVPTRTPTPTPTALASILQPQGVIVPINGGADDLVGDLYIDPDFVVSYSQEENRLVVRDRFFLELFVFDPHVGNLDGDGIESVDFDFFCPNGEQYHRTERTARFCAFGGGEPDCNVILIHSGDLFPNSQCEVANDFYDVQITAHPKNQDLETGQWFFQMRPEIP